MSPQHHVQTMSRAAMCIAIALTAAIASAQTRATGYVFYDANENGVRDSGEKGIANIPVSNGRDVVLTDDDGLYRISISDDTVIFVIKPDKWKTHTDKDNLPRFYYIHKPTGSKSSKFPGVEPTGPLPESVDFALTPQEEPGQFDVIFFGDPQPRNVEEVHYLAHDIVEELIGSDAAFGVTLGDIVFNDLNVFGPINGVIGTIGIPWYNVIGNHDLNFDTENDNESDETFERIYGPPYYAYNYGGVHFVVMDDVAWHGDGYHGEFGPEQLAFLENDLSHVPKETLVVCMMHIPLTTVDDKEKFLAILGDRPNTFSISAHWHRQGHFSLGEDMGWDGDGTHHHLVQGTTSGSWWSGLKDEWDIPHTLMRDGTPNGYSIATFSGNKYSLRYKASRRPGDFQMSIFAPDVVSGSDPKGAEIVVNVFMGSNDSEVTMRIGTDGSWTPLTQTEREDPYYKKLKDREYYLPPAAGRRLPDIVNSPHVWAAPVPSGLPAGAHVIYVKATDTFGHTHTDERILRVE